MKWSEINALLKKDLLDLRRSPVTLFLMTLVPGVLLPLFMLSSTDFATGVTGQLQSISCRAAMIGQSPMLSRFLAKARKVELVPSRGAPAKELLSKGECDAVIVVPSDFDQNVKNETQVPVLKVLYDSRYDQSMLSVVGLSETIGGLRAVMSNERMRSEAIELKRPQYSIVNLDAALEQSHLPHKLAFSYVALLFFAIYVAATSVAVELVTAERERYTLESLLLTAVSRESIMAGKLICVFGFCLLCAVITTITFLGKTVMGHLTVLNLPDVLLLMSMVFPLVAILAFTIASILVLTCSYARSIQQATGYAFWVLILMMVPASAAASGESALSSGAVFFPIGNLVIAIVDTLRGRAELPWVMAAACVSLFYCWAFTQPIPGLLKREDQLYNLEVSPSVRINEGRWVQQLVVLFSTVFLMMFYISPLAVSWVPLLGLFLSQVTGVLLPGIVFLKLYRLPVQAVTRVVPCHWKFLLGAALLAPATVALASAVAAVQALVMPTPEAFFKQLMNYVVPPGAPLSLVLLTAGATPGVCEEFLFRGVFLGLLSRRMRPVPLVVTVGMIFGIFHFSMFRLLPTATLGIVLGFMALRAGSIIPCMILHACHNSLSVLLSVYPRLPDSPAVIIGSVAASLAGAWLFFSATNSTDSKPAQSVD